MKSLTKLFTLEFIFEGPNNEYAKLINQGFRITAIRRLIKRYTQSRICVRQTEKSQKLELQTYFKNHSLFQKIILQ